MKAPKINRYDDGGKVARNASKKMTAEEWNRYAEIEKKYSPYPGSVPNPKGYKSYYDPTKYQFDVDPNTGQVMMPLSSKALVSGIPANAQSIEYDYVDPVVKKTPAPQRVVPTVDPNHKPLVIGPTGTFDPNTGTHYADPAKQKVVPPVTKAEGGSIKAPFLKKKVDNVYFGGGNVLTEDEKRQKFVMKGGKKYDPSGKEVPLTPDQQEKLNANQQQNAQLKQQAGQTLGAYGSGYYASQGMTGNEGKDMRTSTLGAVSQAGTIGGVIGGVAAIGDQIGEPTRKDLEKTDAQGNVKNKQGAIQGAMIGTTFSPSKRLEYEGGLTDVTGEAYIKSIESKAKEKIAAEQFGKEQAARQQQFAAEGGTIKGPGTGKSDSILSRVTKNGIPANSFIVPAENNGLAKKIRKEVLGDNPNKDAKFQKLNGGGEAKADVAVSNGEHLFTPAEKKKITAKLGEEILEELAPNAEENENEKTKGGEMIKRADGSYSKRGLWDNIRANSGSGKKPTSEMLKQEKEIKSEYANGGYVVEKSSERKGKTHKVTGPDGTVKYFGDANLGQHPNDPERKKAFYARHEENLKNNPYFRAFARETWKDGGTVGSDLSAAKAKQMLHDKTAQGHPLTDKQRKFFGWVAGGRKADGGMVGYRDGTPKQGVSVEFAKDFESKKKDADLKEREALLKEYSSLKGKNDDIAKFRISQIGKRVGEIEKRYPDIKIPTKTGSQLENIPSSKPSALAGKVKAGKKSDSAKKTGLEFVPKMAEDNQEYPAVPGSENQPVTEAIDPRFKQPTPLTDTQADLLVKSAQTVKPGETGYPAPPKKKGLGDFLNKNWGSALEMGASAAQIGMGLKGLSEERPVDKIDPLFQANVDKAQAAAKYGFTPEENALLEQQNQSALNAARFAARNYAGGNAGTAYVQERNAINEGYGNALKKAIANKSLMMDKQQYADQMALQKAQMSRNLFGDKLNAWTQKQSSAGELLGAGLSNLIDSQRYKDSLEAYKQRQQQYGN